MRNPKMTDSDAHDDFRKSLRAMRDAVIRLQQDYAYLSHVKNAGDDLLSAIDAFDRQTIEDINQHQEELARTQTMHGGG